MLEERLDVGTLMSPNSEEVRTGGESLEPLIETEHKGNNCTDDHKPAMHYSITHVKTNKERRYRLGALHFSHPREEGIIRAGIVNNVVRKMRTAFASSAIIDNN